MARRRPRAWSCTRCAAAGWTRATSSAVRCARRAPTRAGGRVSGWSWRPTSPTAACSSSRRDVDDTFRAFLALSEQAVVWDRPELLALAGDTPVTPFDVAAPDLGDSGSRFTLDGVEVTLPVPGAHNARNAAAALTAARLAGADLAQAAAALADFAGAGRRFERLGTAAAGALVVDDYAHHPTEVRATI